MSFLVSVLALVACGGGKEPAPPPAVSPSSPAPSATAAEPAPEPTIPAVPPKRRPLEVHSSCADVVMVAFAADPKAPNASKRTIAPNSEIVDAPRNDDNTQTVWLLDANGEPLVKVNVTRAMKRVEIGRSCRTLDAR